MVYFGPRSKKRKEKEPLQQWGDFILFYFFVAFQQLLILVHISIKNRRSKVSTTTSLRLVLHAPQNDAGSVSVSFISLHIFEVVSYWQNHDSFRHDV